MFVFGPKQIAQQPVQKETVAERKPCYALFKDAISESDQTTSNGFYTARRMLTGKLTEKHFSPPQLKQRIYRDKNKLCHCSEHDINHMNNL